MRRLLSPLFALAVFSVALSGAPERAEARPMFFIEADAGVSYVNLLTFDNDNLAPEVAAFSGTGFTFGASSGIEFGPVQLGLRGSVSRHENFNLNTIGLHTQFNIPIPVVQPFIRLGFGYAFLGNTDFNVFSGQPSVRGFHLGLGAGIDIRLGDKVSLGFGVDAVVLNLNRERAVSNVVNFDATQSGSAVGLQIRGTAALSFHL